MRVDVDFGDNPDPQAIAEWRQQLKALQVLYDRALDRAQEAHRLRAELLEKQGQYQTDIAVVNGQIPGAQAAAKTSRDLVAELAARIEEHRLARDAATGRLLGMLQTKRPLALLPVRLETRFVARQPNGDGVDFLIRIYPDDIHIDAHEPGLTEDEELWGRQFWKHTTAAGDDLEKQKLAWRLLADRFGIRRASWIARVLAKQPASVPRRDAAWTRAPETIVLPDRWVAIAYNDERPVFTAWGDPIADRLITGLSPGVAEPGVASELPPVNEGMRWMLDFEAAIAGGMGMRVPLSTDLAQKGIDRLLIVGVKANIDAETSGTRLAALFDAQHYTHDLAFVPQNTPTNNTTEAPAGYASSELSANRDFEIERGSPLVRAGDGSDGDLLATALGLASDVFAHVGNANLTEQRSSHAMNRALWPVLDSFFIHQLSAQVPAAFLREHLVEHIRARGPLPSIRVGNQPYGLLPATSLRRWRSVGETVEEAALVNGLRKLSQLSRLYGNGAPRVDLGTDMPTLLRQEANSCRYSMTHLANGGAPVGDALSLRRSSTPLDDASLYLPPNPNYLRILRQSNADTIRSEKFPAWDAKNAPKPHALLYLLLRQAALRLFDTQDAVKPEFEQSLAVLETLTVAALQFLMAETLDLSTYRLDAWITSLATKRLKALRRNAPLGLSLGGYGWLENVRPAAPLRQVQVASGTTTGPVYVSDRNKGFVHAPSLAHATTAAVLRSGYLSHKEDADGDPLAVNLSSERVHRANWVLDGVRHGQSLGALLGYRFERALHDNHLDQFISSFRALAGLKQQDELAKAYENLRQAETLAQEVADLYEQSREAAARADVARLLKQQLESELKRYQDEINAINALNQIARAADAKVFELDKAIAALEKPQSKVLGKPGKPNVFDVDILEEKDLDDWTDQIQALQLQREQAFNDAKLAHSNFDERVNVRDSDQAKINALNNSNNPNSIPAIQATIATEDAAAQSFDQQALSKEGKRGKAEEDLAMARAALGELLNHQWEKALESLAANNVVDGLELQRRWKAGKRRQLPQKPWDATTIPFGNAALGFPAPESDEFKSLDIQLQALDEMVDAVSDVIVAESVYHLVQGNPLRSGATLDAIATGEMVPPEPEVVRTPRTGIGITHRLVALWSSSLNLDEAVSQWKTNADQVRAQAEPFLNAWSAKLLGNPSRVRCRAEYVHPKTGEVLHATEVPLSNLQLSPLDVVFLAESSEQPQQSELEQRLIYQLLRSKPSSVLEEANVRLIFSRDPQWHADILSIGELVEVARTIRQLIVGGRAIDGRDLSLPEAPIPSGLDVDELGSRADLAVNFLIQSQKNLQTLLSSGDGSAPGTSVDLEKLRPALIRMAHLGVRGAIPLSATGDNPDQRTTLMAQARSIAKEVSQRLDRVGKLGSADEGSADAKRDYHLARIREVLGPDFRILPRFTPSNGGVLNQAFGDSVALQGNDRFAATTWFQRVARVREGVGQLDAALMYAETIGNNVNLTFQVGQLPYEHNARWVALPPAHNQTIPGGRLSLAAHVPMQMAIDLSQPLSGLLVDEWVEVVPSDYETTGLAFHYDQPSACAPQVVLIAVPSDDSRLVWDLDMLTAMLNETLEMVQLRAVSLNGLMEASWFEDRLPAGATARGEGENWNWVSTDPVPFRGKLAHQSAVATGMHQHYFEGAIETMLAGPGEMLFLYVFLDPSHPPTEVMLQWNDGSWEHRSYWGANDIGWGVDGTTSRRFMGPLPPVGQWVRLEVPVELVGLEGREIAGMAFTLSNGRATWDRAGKACHPALTFDADEIDLSRAADPNSTEG